MKNKSKNLLACVIYKGVETYISNLLQSVSLQSSKDFDLLIFNDGVSDTNVLSNYKSKKVSFSQVKDFHRLGEKNEKISKLYRFVK